MKKAVLLALFLMLLVIAVGASVSATAIADPQDTETYNNLYAAVQGETNANATYKAFAEKAQAEGYPAVARLFLATADAEAKHAADEWAILVGMGATAHPVAAVPSVGTTAENLQAAFEGETYEYTVMYPDFLAAAQAEGITAAVTIFNRAMRAEQVHAGNYADVLANLGDAAYLNTKYATVYRCIVCGEVVTALPARCPICGAAGDSFVIYNGTYFNLYAAVQGETNANATYKAFAEKAQAEGYPAVARLFLATADAEEKHAADEWAILEGMGATEHPVAAAPSVGTTAENLLAAFNGETYEYTVMYPDFLAVAQAEGMTAAQTIFNRAMRAEQVHAGNYADVLANLGDAAYLNTKYATVYRCIVCGEVVTELPARCPICGASGDSFVVYNRTYFNLYAAVQGETNANATYKAFAEKAQADGYPAVARLFLATADAEAKHAADEWAILVGMGATVHPVAAVPSVGTTAENLKAAFDGETYEYTVMYPDFLAAAQAEGMAAAQTIFNRAMRAEQVHAGNYADVLANLGDAAYLNTKYATVYRCIVCGEVVTERPARCPICNASGDSFVMYNGTYFNLYAAVQGETNANAAYLAFAAKAQAEGYPAVARLFLATADAEAKHAADEWEILEGMGATEHPVAAEPSVGTTAENLQAAFDGETYEYTVMYPDFLAVAQAEGMTAAQTIFNRAMRAEQVHAGNYGDVLANLDNANYLNSKYAILFRCIVCGEVVTERPARCPICGAAGDSFVVYRDGPVLLSLSTNAESDISGDVVYTLSLKGAENVLDIEVEFTVDGSLLAGKGVVAESGFSTISDIAWSYAGGNLWIGKTTLAYKSGGELTGFDSEPSADVAKFVFSPRAAGIATMSLKNIRVAGFDAEADLVVDFDYILLAGEATTIIDQFIFSKYDLNKDNKIDALDLGIMLLYCGFSEDSPGWDSYVKVNDTKGKGVTASMCDVNGDGIIDMLDLLDLFIHYTK